MENLQSLRKIVLAEELSTPPRRRDYCGEWVEVVIGIGPDHTAYVSMPEDAFQELLRLTRTTEED